MRNIFAIAFATVLLAACQSSGPVNSQAPQAPKAEQAAIQPTSPAAHWQSNYRSVQSISAAAFETANKKFSARMKHFTSEALSPDVAVMTLGDLNKNGYFKASHLGPENQVLRLQVKGHFSQTVPGQNNQMVVLEYDQATAIFNPLTGDMLALNLR